MRAGDFGCLVRIFFSSEGTAKLKVRSKQFFLIEFKMFFSRVKRKRFESTLIQIIFRIVVGNIFFVRAGHVARWLIFACRVVGMFIVWLVCTTNGVGGIPHQLRETITGIVFCFVCLIDTAIRIIIVVLFTRIELFNNIESTKDQFVRIRHRHHKCTGAVFKFGRLHLIIVFYLLQQFF